MMKFLSNALLGVLVDKKARAKVAQHRKAKTRDGQIAAIRESAQRVMTPERQELIRRAMELQRAKSKIFNDLNDDQKREAIAMMLKGMLNEKDTGDGGNGQNS